MPNYNGTITEFAQGDDIDIVRTITNIPSGQTITTATFSVRVYEASIAAKITKTITPIATVAGVIVGNKLTFALSGADTQLLNPGNWEYYSIELTTNAGKVYTPEKGKIKAEL